MQNQTKADEYRSEDVSRPYNLMDGATGEGLQVIRELDEQRKISADSALPLEMSVWRLMKIFLIQR
jgi:hypothetical protein